ncbi:HBR471Cp [Eremothecium sinecaudum]|uniref:HBR471Cp n=1 Tax=Eremothecium sinecaudum TaxID=45286 RepID=A0A109UYB0_9SACH|nr:HBR471Cp [Eremothecium sinecaudum]AMD19372.1 HBR471Cp [Eremothecium sinecaudum]
MSDKIRQEQLFQTMKQKHLGLGTDNTSKAEWFTQINRDTYNTLIGHTSLLEYTALGSSSTKAETRLSLIDKMCNDYTRGI